MVGDCVDDMVGDRVGDMVGAIVYGSVGDSMGGRVGDMANDTVGDMVDDKVCHVLGDRNSEMVGNKVCGKMYDRLWSWYLSQYVCLCVTVKLPNTIHRNLRSSTIGVRLPNKWISGSKCNFLCLQKLTHS